MKVYLAKATLTDYTQQAKLKLEALEAERVRSGRDILIRIVALNDTATVFARLIARGSLHSIAVVFDLEGHAFLCTPRTGTLWETQEIEPGYAGQVLGDGKAYQLLASGEYVGVLDNNSFPVGGGVFSPILDPENPGFQYSPDGFSYGNLLWLDDTGETILSWQSLYSPGIPHIPLTEPFQAILYQDGSLIEPQPPGAVLGAGYVGDILYCVCSDGADTIVTKLDTSWVECGRWNTGRIKIPFLLRGTVFSAPDGTTVTIGTNVVTYQGAATTHTGTQAEAGTGVDIVFTKSGTRNFNGISLSLSSVARTQSTNTTTSSTASFPVILSGSYASQATISGPHAVTVGAVYNVTYNNGLFCSWVWSGVSYINNNAEGTSITVTGVSSCGIGTIIARADTGASASMEVRYPSGVWIYERTVGSCVSFCNDYGFPKVTSLYSGGARYDVEWYAGYKCDTTPPGGESISGIDASGNTWKFPDIRPVQTVSGSSCNPGCVSPYSVVSNGWGSCGVCGSCVSCAEAYAYISASCYRVYRWVCP